MTIKSFLKNIFNRLPQQETKKFFLFLFFGLLLYFILPTEPLDPWGVIQLRFLWGMILFVIALQFISFIILSVWRSEGLLVMGFLVGLVNSNILNGSMGALSKQNRRLSDACAAAIVSGNLAMLVRNLVVVAVLGFPAFLFLIVPIGAMLIVGVITILKYTRGNKIKKFRMKIENPFAVKTAIEFAGIVTVITIISLLINRFAGELGLYATAFVSVFAAGVPILLSSLVLAKAGQITYMTVATIVMIISFMGASNDIILQLSIGSKDLARSFVKQALPMVFVGLVILGIELIIFSFV